jgi:foldase protein PrsA
MRKLLAVTGACLLLAGGAGSAHAQKVPGDAVAIVDDVSIAKADYAHWFEVNARGESAPDGKPVVIPDPPSYARCIAALRARARGRKAPSRSRLRASCRTRERRARQNTMALLIQAVWFEKEAAALGIEVTDARVEQKLRTARRESFPRRGDYERFLRQTGMTEGDVLFRLRVQLLGEAIARHVQRGAGKDKDRRLTAYGRAFQKRWRGQTECRSGFVMREYCGNA